MEEDEVEELTPSSNKSVVWTYFGFLCKRRENDSSGKGFPDVKGTQYYELQVL